MEQVQAQALNPFNTDNTNVNALPATVHSDTERAIQEVQAALVIAKRFPRDKKSCMDDILKACMSKALASQATYTYKRGNQEITGPTIRLAEVIAQGWCNMQFGIRELSQANGESTVEAFAWDTERNNRVTKTFQVPHVRHTRQGSKHLTDSRDIYELIANYGARRLRNCILDVIPGDVREAALKQCDLTMAADADTSPEAIKRMLDKFQQDHNVNKNMIEDYIGCRVDAIKPAQIVALRKIYNSLRDGYSNASDWFQGLQEKPAPNDSPLNEKLQKAQANAEKANAEKANVTKAKPPANK